MKRHAQARTRLLGGVVTALACLGCSGCSGRLAPPASGSQPGSIASDDGPGFGGTITPLESGAGDDATLPFASGPGRVDGLDAGPGDDGPAAAAEVNPSPPGPPFDAGPDGLCSLPLAPGDLVIDELLVESMAGTGDHGEWLEVTSALPCAIDLRGLHGECPRGGKVAAFDVSDDLWVPAGGTFVVADSVSPAINHDVPGPVVAWHGNLGDVLRNKGTTVTLTMADVVIDSLTYPALSLTVGASLAFPADCDPPLRSDFTRWQTSVASWFPGFKGTPNAPNTDVTCPM